MDILLSVPLTVLQVIILILMLMDTYLLMDHSLLIMEL